MTRVLCYDLYVPGPGLPFKLANFWQTDSNHATHHCIVLLESIVSFRTKDVRACQPRYLFSFPSNLEMQYIFFTTSVKEYLKWSFIELFGPFFKGMDLCHVMQIKNKNKKHEVTHSCWSDPLKQKYICCYSIWYSLVVVKFTLALCVFCSSRENAGLVLSANVLS